MPSRVRAALVWAPVLLLVGVGAVAAARSPQADAASVHRDGFHARVAGVRNWYGTYDMGALGIGWCIDPHVDHPPDPDLAYAPNSVGEADDDTRAALAWAAGSNPEPDPVSAAAVTLVAHDLLDRSYRGAPLEVEHLGPGDFEGFGGAESAIIARAQEIERDALAHRHLRGPYSLHMAAAEVRPGERGELVATLVDANGVGVAGAPVYVGASGAAFTVDVLGFTGHDGVARFGFTAEEGPVRLGGFAVVPDTSLAAYGPTRGPGQRVIVPRRVQVEAETGFEARRPPGEVVVDKRGDVEVYLPVGGALFELRPVGSDPGAPPAARLTTDESGHAGPVTLPPGRYTLVEVTPPAGYGVAPPQEVEVRSGERTSAVVLDTARRGRLRLSKEDAVTHDLVAGARFSLRYDADRDGVAERELRELTTDAVPTVVADLPPGDYQLVEVEPPPGYAPLAEPVAVQIRPGETAELRVPNQPRSTVRFEKRPDASARERERTALPSFAGAVFVVRGPVDPDTTEPPEPLDAPEVGRCTTDDEGRCGLPEASLEAGSRYCWDEVEVPAGWAAAEAGCFTAGGAGTSVTVTVDEPLAPPPPTTTTSTTPPTTTTPPSTTPATPPSSPPPSAAPPGRPPSAAPPALAGPGPSLPRTGGDSLLLGLAGALLTAAGAAATWWASSRVDRREVV